MGDHENIVMKLLIKVNEFKAKSFNINTRKRLNKIGERIEKLVSLEKLCEIKKVLNDD